MKKRNNVIGLLMDKVPRRNKEGYAPTDSMDGHLMLVEIRSRGDIAEFVDNHVVFGKLRGNDRANIYQAILKNAVLRRAGGHECYIIKIRILCDDMGRMSTSLARLGTRYARMFTFVSNGAVNQRYDRGAESATINAAEIIEFARDMTTITCHCPDDLDPNAFDFAEHGVHAE